ncbi:MAG: hypothetical protein ACTSWL_06845 [Promethearchaeota archaeon]
MEEHQSLDMEYDRELLEDVLDSPDLRYVALYMYILRKELFMDLINDDLIESFDTIMSLEEPTVGDLNRICEGRFIKSLIQFHVITNIKSYDAFQIKNPQNKVRIAKGIRLIHQELDESDEEIHIFFNEKFLERVIAPSIPEMTQIRIMAALKRLRAMMCPKTPIIHTLVHNYGDDWVLDDGFYYLLEELGNPYQALRIELMIRTMSGKYTEIETQLNDLLNIFDPILSKSPTIKKLRKARDLKKTNYLQYLIEKSRKTTLPIKFRVEFPKDEVPEEYTKWKTALNTFLELKLKFDEINQQMDKLRAYYSGKKQVMPYMSFIEKTSYDDEIADEIKKLLVQARNNLKSIRNESMNYPKKEMKLLNLKIDQLIIEEGLDEEED